MVTLSSNVRNKNKQCDRCKKRVEVLHKKAGMNVCKACLDEILKNK